MFLAALTRASRFLPFKLPSFLFLSLKLPSWFLQFIEVVVHTSGDRKSSDRRLKFSWSVYLFTRTYLHLSLSSLYAYISIFISFYDSFSCLNASVLTVFIIISFMNLLILIQRVFWIFVYLVMYILCRFELLLTNDTQTKKWSSLQNIDSNVVLNLMHQSKQTCIISALLTWSLSLSLLQSLSSSPSSRIHSVWFRSSFAVFSSLHTASLLIFINFLNSVQLFQQTTSASRSTNLSCNAFQELIFNYWDDEHTLEFFMKRCFNCTALHWKFKSVFNLYSYIVCCSKDDELLDSLSDSSSLIKSLFEDDTA